MTPELQDLLGVCAIICCGVGIITYLSAKREDELARAFEEYERKRK